MTAVQKLLTYVTIYLTNKNFNFLTPFFIKAIEQEKQQIKDAYNQGYRDALDYCGNDINYKDEIADNTNAEDYYNETFKNEN